MRFLTLVLLCMTFGSALFAQQPPPQAIQAAFAATAPQATGIAWHPEGELSWRAEYTLAGKNQVARFATADASLIERVELMPFSSVPANVVSTLSRFDPYTLHNAGTAHRPNGTTLLAIHFTYGGNTNIVLYFNDQHQMVERRLLQ